MNGGGTKVADMYAELRLEDQKYHAGMARARNETLAFVGQITGTFGQLRGSLNTMLASTVVRGTVSFFQEAITQAGNYQDVLNRTKAVLKGSADIVISESDRMANKLGVVKSEYLGAATSFAASFKGAGFGMQEAARIGNQLTSLGMDLASFANTTNADAFGALQAALRGEFDPIERYNVFINAAKIETEAFSMGLIKNKSELDDHAKRMAALSLIMKQTKDAQGDLTNTIDDQNNATRRLSGIWTNFMTELGQSFQPAVAAVLPRLTEMASEFVDFARDHQDDIKAMAQVIGTDLAGALQTVSGLAHQNIENFKSLAAAWENAPDWVKGLTGGVGGEVAGAAGGEKNLFSALATIDMREKAAFEASKKGGSSDLAANIDAFTAGLGLPSLPGGTKPERVLAPDELSENQKRHLREEEERMKRRPRPRAGPAPAPGAGGAGGAPPEAGPGGILSPAQRKAAIATQTLPWDQLTPEEQYGVIQKQKQARKRALEMGQVPEAQMTAEEQFDATRKRKEERQHALELGKVPEAQMTAEERLDVKKKRDDERQKAIEAGSITFGQMTPEEQVEALKKQRSTIADLMPKEPTRQSQLFTEGGSMEQQFQQRILEQTDKQDEANKLLQKIDEGIAKLNEATLKKATDKGYAMIAPAGAARR